MLLVPYQSKRGDYAIKSIKKRMKCLRPTVIVTIIACVGNNFNKCFRMKDVTEFKHNHNIIYQGRCPEIDCYDYYLGETGRRISESVLDHGQRDQNSFFSNIL